MLVLIVRQLDEVYFADITKFVADQRYHMTMSETEIVRLGFKEVGAVRIVASSDMETEKALDMATTLIKMARDEAAEALSVVDRTAPARQ